MKIPQWSTDEKYAHVVEEIQEVEILKVQDWTTEKEDSNVVKDVENSHFENKKLNLIGIELRTRYCLLNVDSGTEMIIYIFHHHKVPFG